MSSRPPDPRSETIIETEASHLFVMLYESVSELSCWLTLPDIDHYGYYKNNNNTTFILRKFHTEMFRCALQLKEKIT